MKILVTYYSRTGITKKVAELIAKTLKADTEEIISVANRLGKEVYGLCGKEAFNKTLAEIKPIKKDVSNYDIVILGTPVWCFRMASPIRTYLEKNKSKFKKVAYFATQGGMGAGLTFKAISKIINKNPIAKLKLNSKTIMTNNFKNKLDKFIKIIKI